MGGGGLSGGSRPIGVDDKDDLKDFHEALAVQATSQQVIAYKAMVKSTAEASAELQSLIGQVGTSDASARSSRAAVLEVALEKARTENKNFIEGFSGPQKNGLKEITKKLAKADSELAQQAKELNQKVVETKEPGEVITGAAQNLEHALTDFQNVQVSLGTEMSIVISDSQDATFNIAPVKNSINFQNQPVAIVTSGVISQGGAETGQHTFMVKLAEDISDLQQNITEVLRAQLDKADRCGERVAIQNATISPQEPESLVVTQLHFERWVCFGGQNNEIAEGDGTLEVKLTAEVADDGTLRVTPAISRIDAEGVLAESLRSGSLGPELRDKIGESVLSAMRQGGDLKALLPPAAQGHAKLRHAQFQATGAGALMVALDGDIRVSDDQATALTSQLNERASSQQKRAQQTSLQQSIPR